MELGNHERFQNTLIYHTQILSLPHQANLFKMSGTPPSNESENQVARKIPHMEKLTEKTTRMLLAVLFMFLIVELPQSVLTVLSAFLGDMFFKWVVIYVENTP